MLSGPQVKVFPHSHAVPLYSCFNFSNSQLTGRRASDGFVHIPTSSSIFQHHPAAAVAAAGFVPLASRAGGHFDLHDVTEEHVVQLQQVYSLTICLPLFVDINGFLRIEIFETGAFSRAELVEN